MLLIKLFKDAGDGRESRDYVSDIEGAIPEDARVLVRSRIQHQSVIPGDIQ